MSKTPRFLKKIISAAMAAALAVGVMATSVSAETYINYSYDRWGDAAPSQAGYTAIDAINGLDLGVGGLGEPADLFIDEDDLMYIADKLNNRILVTTLDFELVRIYDKFSFEGGTLTLKGPSGIFVDDRTGFMYVADTDNSRVIKTDKDGNVDMLFTKPQALIYGEQTTFNPSKVCVDDSGNVYVVARSINRGAVMFDETGEFLGFYGANTVMATTEVVLNAFWNLISTEQQKLRSATSAPVGFNNFDIVGQFIFTVTEQTTATSDQVKKLNPRGDNVLDAIEMQGENFGDIMPVQWNIYLKQTQMTDIDIGDNGELNLLDFAHGRVHQFDEDGYRLFIMGGSGNQLGQFRAATAIESRGDYIYVLDSVKDSITVFKRTVFGEIVSNASQYFNRAEYAESKGMWEEVLKYDGNYRRAFTGIGLAALFDKDYTTAMENFEIAMNRYYYSQAFQGYRNELLRKYFAAIVIGLVVVVAAGFAYSGYRKRHPKKRERSI
jgi:DNA-binding beta-propeller fold protein YncE